MNAARTPVRDRLMKAAARSPAWLTVVIALLTVAALAVVDYVSGSEFAFSLFYLAPILYATWFAGPLPGVFIAGVSAVTWGIIDIAAGAQYSVPAFAVWNAGVRLGFFLLGVWLLSKLRQAQADLVALAHTDTLTGVANTRSFYLEVEREIERSRRYGHPFVLAYIDLDRFKSVNDEFGHAAGDELLRRVAHAITQTVRESDRVARLGGDEFAILMPETQESTASVALERVRSRLTGAMPPGGERGPCVDATIGAVVFAACPESADAAVKLADELMYEGKRDGRATVRITVYPSTQKGSDSASHLTPAST